MRNSEGTGRERGGQRRLYNREPPSGTSRCISLQPAIATLSLRLCAPWWTSSILSCNRQYISNAKADLFSTLHQLHWCKITERNETNQEIYCIFVFQQKRPQIWMQIDDFLRFEYFQNFLQQKSWLSIKKKLLKNTTNAKLRSKWFSKKNFLLFLFFIDFWDSKSAWVGKISMILKIKFPIRFLMLISNKSNGNGLGKKFSPSARDYERDS